MEIKKVSNSFNEYRLSCSYGELEAIRNALSRSHEGPVADELYQGFVWHLARLPKPGEEEDTEEEGRDEGDEVKLAKSKLDREDTGSDYQGHDHDSEESLERYLSGTASIADLDRVLPPPPQAEAPAAPEEELELPEEPEAEFEEEEEEEEGAAGRQAP